jgi:hypothetical protein
MPDHGFSTGETPMSFFKDKLDRLQAYFERENGRHDEILRGRSTWWHVAKIALGLAFVVRSVLLVLHAQGVSSYALALLFLLGGTFFAYEGAAMLRYRLFDAKRP